MPVFMSALVLSVVAALLYQLFNCHTNLNSCHSTPLI